MNHSRKTPPAPRPNPLADRHGHILSIGDPVLIPCTVLAVGPGNVTVETDGRSPRDGLPMRIALPGCLLEHDGPDPAA